jgi:hypothetical protein
MGRDRNAGPVALSDEASGPRTALKDSSAGV